MAGYMSRRPPNSSVYVCNLPPGTDETMLAEYFGTIGLLKVWVLSGNILATTMLWIPCLARSSGAGRISPRRLIVVRVC
jgi:hypothetical protein